MQLTRALELLVLGLSAMSVAEATFVGVKGAGREVKGIQQRQADDAANTDAANTDAAATTEADPPKTTSSSVPAETTSSAPQTIATTSSSSVKPPVTSSQASETPAPSTSKAPSSTTKDTPQSSSKPPSETTSAAETQQEASTFIITTVVTTTDENGSAVTYTRSTTTPGLAGDSSGQASGMSTQTRNTVIGVVVGVGGAIILGGLALVAWRIWGRKKHQEENDGLMDYGSAIESKPESGGSMAGRTPFQSTLESYHAPTQVNTAANF
ncbi:hypothetical protein C8A01DRAFT_32052 [Parachaetomium inaequale]|uniref:Mid2 domain-containing protein n=1 Tax=Parachaetomium inaequale TaxID=2588326 RepID=A0AAN6PMF9_9PEZI|nr:hypothetical protein C8A01DRAFT_32052 [Parachaetomium inaequale]